MNRYSGTHQARQWDKAPYRFLSLLGAVGIVAALGMACTQDPSGESGSTDNSGTGSGSRDGSPSELLALLPADEEFQITFGDLEARREAINLPEPADTVSDDELTDYAWTLLTPDSDSPPAGTTLGLRGETGRLLPLARASIYVTDTRSGVEVLRGHFADDAFGEPESNADGDGYTFIADQGTVTIAPDDDSLDAARSAQQGEAASMADMEAATALVEALDELGVIDGLVVAFPDGELVDAVGSGVAPAGSNEDRTWHLIVAHHPAPGSDLDLVTDNLAGVVADAADGIDAEVVDVAAHESLAVTTLLVGGARDGELLHFNFDPLLFPATGS